MDNTEHHFDEMLKIRTSGRDDTNADEYNYPYEPTPYSVLERLGNSGLINKKNVLIDYGCGKGRAGFYLSYQCRCKSVGIEYDERIYMVAMANKDKSVSRRCEFHLGKAEDFVLPPESDRFYFFNPFSVEILFSVLNKILESYYENPREMLLFFYYPSEEYIAHLMTHDGFSFYDEIDCEDLFPGSNRRERIIIFSVD